MFSQKIQTVYAKCDLICHRNKTEITFSGRPREIHIFKLKIFSKLSIIKTILNLKMLNNFQALRYSRSLGRVIGWGRQGRCSSPKKTNFWSNLYSAKIKKRTRCGKTHFLSIYRILVKIGFFFNFCHILASKSRIYLFMY